MNTLRDKLANSLGAFGIAVWYALTMLYTFAPLLTVFNFGLLITVAIVAVATFAPTVGGIIQLILYVWGFFRALSMPFSGWILVFYICFALYFFTQLLPILRIIFARNR